MNLIDILKDQLLNPANLDKLGSLVGESRETTEKAVTGGIPALLAGLMKLTGNSGGLGQLTQVLQSVQGLKPEAMGDSISSLDKSAIDKGGSILGSLLGGGKSIAFAMMLAKLLGIDAKAITKILGTLAPLILGVIANQWKQKGGTPDALGRLFSEQKGSIEAALPKGLSLADIPDLGDAQAALAKGSEAGTSLVKKLLPLVALAAGGLALFSIFRGSGTEPEPAAASGPVAGGAVDVNSKIKEAAEAQIKSSGFEKISADLTSQFGLLTESLQSVKDVASAEAALPKIQNVGTTLDTVKALVDKLPDEGKMAISQLLKGKMGDLSALIEKVLGIPGVGEKIKPALDLVLGKFKGLGA